MLTEQTNLFPKETNDIRVKVFLGNTSKIDLSRHPHRDLIKQSSRTPHAYKPNSRE
jgi:hypothetical protein